MSGTDLEIARARARAEAARARVMATAQTLKQRVSPSTLASNAWETVRGRGEVAADKARTTAKAHPVSVGMAAFAAALFVVRKPVAKFVGRVTHRNGVVTHRDQATEADAYRLSEGHGAPSPETRPAGQSGLF